ncbi:MAG: nuclear transport factor 2 family protein [Candidatus Thorarchaeota archaeon]|nr:nuclear transport factor 2 family protein [Candidatus Thorarchaeota archaeon]
MSNIQNAEQIIQVAMDFDHALTSMDIDEILPFFSEECEIEILGVTLRGLDGAKQWLEWLFTHLIAIQFEPVIIMVEGNVFFEEFVVVGTLSDGRVVRSKQAEVLVYDDYKIKTLRLYFDRLDFVDSIANGFLEKRVVGMLIKRSLEGLGEPSI